MKENDRFVRIYTSGIWRAKLNEVWVDRETGVNYLFHAAGYAGGLCPLLDRDGKPVVTDPDSLGRYFE